MRIQAKLYQSLSLILLPLGLNFIFNQQFYYHKNDEINILKEENSNKQSDLSVNKSNTKLLKGTNYNCKPRNKSFRILKSKEDIDSNAIEKEPNYTSDIRKITGNKVYDFNSIMFDKPMKNKIINSNELEDEFIDGVL